jgi:hypothetical protein
MNIKTNRQVTGCELYAAGSEKHLLNVMTERLVVTNGEEY